MIKFTKEHILILYKKMVAATGGACGIRSVELLESALEAPFQTFAGEELYSTLYEKAARLGYGFIRNHPFVDGNKRVGIYIMLCYLKMNGLCLIFSNEEIVNIALRIASGDMAYEELLSILIKKDKQK